MGDDEVDRPEPPPAKAVTALLREVRSLSRRADKPSTTSVGSAWNRPMNRIVVSCAA
jgi:hypothetical protein